MADEAREQRLLAQALRAGTPIEGLDEDGFRIASLLVAKLRFGRLMQGSLRAGEAFEADSRAFTELFRAYHRETPPLAAFPAQEGRRFEAWLERRSDGSNQSPEESDRR